MAKKKAQARRLTLDDVIDKCHEELDDALVAWAYSRLPNIKGVGGRPKVDEKKAKALEEAFWTWTKYLMLWEPATAGTHEKANKKGK